MCNYRHEVNTILAHMHNDNGSQKRKLCKGIAKYLTIRSMYKDNTIDEDFLDLFYSFYGLSRQEQNIDRASLQNLIQSGRNKKTIRVPDQRQYERLLNNAITTISRNNTSQFSYSTKVLHTIWNDLPIYDSRVAQFTGFRAKTAATCQSIRTLYDQREQNGLARLVEEYDKLVSSPTCRDLIRFKRKSFTPAQASRISNVKKIDFMIWGFWA